MAEDTKKSKGKIKASTERAKAAAKRNPATGADESKIKKAGEKAVAERQPDRSNKIKSSYSKKTVRPSEAPRLGKGESLKADARDAVKHFQRVSDDASRKETANVRQRQADIVKEYERPVNKLKRGLKSGAGRLASIAARKANLIAGAVVAGMTAAGLLKGDTADGEDFDAQFVGSSMEGGIPMRPRPVEESFGGRDNTADMPVEDRKQHMLEKIGGERRAVFARPHSLPKYDPGVNPAQPPTAGLAPQAERPLSEASFAPRAVQTKGGSYPIFDKASQEAADFRKTFAQARASGQSQFEWQGRLYNTKVK